MSYEVVHCKSQEEWDFSSKKLNRKSSVGYLEQIDNCCIELKNPGCSWSISHCQKDKNVKIYSFEEWCKMNSYTPDWLNNQYQHLPFPNEKPYFTARVVKDIVKKDILPNGILPDVIPAGSITWFDYNQRFFNFIINKKIGIVLPENNRHMANIPSDYFEVIEVFNLEKKESQFEVDKWYKTKMGSYVKYYHTNELGIFVSSEQIMYDIKKYEKRVGNFGPASDFNNFTLLTDLSEIQKYLPDGHEDKIIMKSQSKFKKNDYVTCLPKEYPKDKDSVAYGGAGYAANYCLKIENVDVYDYHVVYFFYNHSNGVYETSLRASTKEEIEHYNKVNKPYDVTCLEKEQAKPKFKIGDEVEVVKKSRQGWLSDNNEFHTIDGVFGYTGKITNIKYLKEGIYYSLDCFEEEEGILEEALELVKKDVKDESKKLGDYIGRYLKALVDFPDKGDVKKGDYGIITSNTCVDFSTQSGYWCGNALNEPNKYQLMPEGFKPDESVDLIEGTYYVAEFKEKSKKIWDSIFISAGNFKLNGRLYINDQYTGNKFDKNNTGNWSNPENISFRLATFSERQWFNKCIAAGKFVPKGEALDVKSDVLINNKGVRFIVGKKYKHNSEEICYYCGLNTSNTPCFELIDFKACSKPNTLLNWISKGNDTYWCFNKLENEFEEYEEEKSKSLTVRRSPDIYIGKDSVITKQPLVQKQCYKQQEGFMKPIRVPKFKKESKLKIII